MSVGRRGVRSFIIGCFLMLSVGRIRRGLARCAATHQSHLRMAPLAPCTRDRMLRRRTRGKREVSAIRVVKARRVGASTGARTDAQWASTPLRSLCASRGGLLARKQNESPHHLHLSPHRILLTLVAPHRCSTAPPHRPYASSHHASSHRGRLRLRLPASSKTIRLLTSATGGVVPVSTCPYHASCMR